MVDFTWTSPGDMQAVTGVNLSIVNAVDLTAVAQVDSGATGTKTATSSIGADPLGNLAMSMVIRPRSDLPAGPDPSPDPDPGGDETIKYAQIDSSQQFTVAAVEPTASTNPAGASYPGYRGPNQLVIYMDPETTTTATNQWGTEVQVGSDDIIDAVNDRQVNEDDTGTSVPSGGYVLSGHGTARTWLNQYATVGGTVTLTAEANPNPTPGGDTPSGANAYPVKAISVYKMMWSVNGPNISTISSNFNVIRLAFLQGSPPSIVGWGSEGQSSALSALASKRSAGVRVIASVGGQGGQVNTSSRSDFMSGVATLKSTLQGGGADLDGLDWDVEASSLNQSDVVWISTQLKSIYGDDFAITFVPNGGVVDTYLPAAVECYRNGACDEYGQQFYDAEVSLSAAKGRISQALGAGLPQSVISVGMMIASDANHWTNAQCASYYTDIRQTWPGITKAYLWEAQRAGTDQWAADMVRING